MQDMDQSASWEANCRWAGQRIPPRLCKSLLHKQHLATCPCPKPDDVVMQNNT
jgi:hypothetical protein